MFTKIAAAGVVAALALGFASVASAKDYDDLLKDKGVIAYEAGAPFPNSEYGQSRGYEARAQARTMRRDPVRMPYAVDQIGAADSWPGQW